ncbi:MAG: type II toxin-antitoxin system YafQ family toxin [Rhodospirillaceae bacterium]|nr:type II toxin-antitoxin system YafQ family toxin [Rhodospirillaceae bacterium]
MTHVRFSTRFKKDFKLAEKRGKDTAKLLWIVERIARRDTLEPRYRLHRLKGEYEGFFECHVEPDWLLIWDDLGDEILLARCGTHSDLFG